MRSTAGCSHNHKRNMLEINCSTLQFCGHGAHIDHMYFIHEKSTRVYMSILNYISTQRSLLGYKGSSCDEILRNSLAN